MKKATIAIILLIAEYLLPCCAVFIYRSTSESYYLQPRDTVESPYVYDLNTITSEQLQQIEGIGPVVANKIVEFRKANGKFTSAEQLLQIDGIGPSIAGKILQYVAIGG